MVGADDLQADLAARHRVVRDDRLARQLELDARPLVVDDRVAGDGHVVDGLVQPQPGAVVAADVVAGHRDVPAHA